MAADDDLSHIYFVGNGRSGGRGARPGRRTSMSGTTVACGSSAPSATTALSRGARSVDQGPLCHPDGNQLVFVTSTPCSPQTPMRQLMSTAMTSPCRKVAEALRRRRGARCRAADDEDLRNYGSSHVPAASDDGQYGVFETYESIDAHDTNAGSDVYRWSWADGSTALISTGQSDGGGSSPAATASVPMARTSSSAPRKRYCHRHRTRDGHLYGAYRGSPVRWRRAGGAMRG